LSCGENVIGFFFVFFLLLDWNVYITCANWQVHKVEWTSAELLKYGFNFLFDKFKDFYLQEIFPEFKKIDIYTSDLGILISLYT